MSIKIRPEIKEKFKKLVVKSGLSTCFVVETLFSAWIAAQEMMEEPGVHRGTTIKITQNIDYLVKRARRQLSVKSDPENCYVNPPGLWVYKEGDTNFVGEIKQYHHRDCVCLYCCPSWEREKVLV